MKTILYLHQYFAFPDSGAGVRSYDLSKKFSENGYDVTFITTTAYLNQKYVTKKGWNYFEKDNLKIWAYESSYSNKDIFILRMWRFIVFMIISTKKSLSIKADIVLATSTPLTIAVPALVNKFFRKIPYIFEVRDVWPELPIAIGAIRNPVLIRLAKKLEKLAYINATHIVGLSEGMKNSILKRIKKVDEKKISVITNISNINRFCTKASNTTFFPIFDRLKDKKILSYVGTFGIINEVSFLVELAQKLEDYEEVVIVVVGDGQQKKDVLKLAKLKGVLNKKIFFLDPIPKNLVPYFLKNVYATFSLFGNVEEMWANSANKFFDSLAAQKPIIINYKGWQKEVIEKYEIGLVLTSELHSFDIKKLIDFIQDEECMQKYSINAYKLANSQYSLEVLSRKYLQILKSFN